MYRRKVVIVAVAVFAIGVAFAAQLTSNRSDRRDEVVERQPWMPGTNELMSAHEASMAPLAPPN